MRIVHCIWSLNTGGAETMLIDIANEQARNQDVYVIIVNDSYEQQLVDKLSSDVKVIFNKRKPNTKFPWPLVKLNLTLFRLYPDIVHIHNGALPRAILSVVSRGQFLTVHDLQVPVEPVRRGVKLIAISDAVKEDVQKRTNHQIRTIANGINISAIAKREPKVFSDKMRIIQVARLDAEKKGQDILIQAVALLKQNGIDNIEVDFIGCGQSLEVLQEQTERLCISDKVNFLGLRDRDYIYSHLKDYDLMCHPARYEGFGLTVAEGIAAMLPVLVSDEGGPYEIIDHGKLGYGFKMESAEDCAAKIEHIYNHFQEALSFTSKAYEKVRSCYSIERMVADYIKYYNESL